MRLLILILLLSSCKSTKPEPKYKSPTNRYLGT